MKLHAGRFAEAHQHLNSVTNEIYIDLKNRLLRNLSEAETKAAGTNSPPAKYREASRSANRRQFALPTDRQKKYAHLLPHDPSKNLGLGHHRPVEPAGVIGRRGIR